MIRIRDRLDAPDHVLDASSLLMQVHEEPGWQGALSLIGGSIISSINWSEVVQKSLRHGVTFERVRRYLEELRIDVTPFTRDDADQTALLWPQTRPFGLSLADRACLALALRAGLPVLTADRVWQQLDVGVKIQLIR